MRGAVLLGASEISACKSQSLVRKKTVCRYALGIRYRINSLPDLALRAPGCAPSGHCSTAAALISVGATLGRGSFLNSMRQSSLVMWVGLQTHSAAGFVGLPARFPRASRIIAGYKEKRCNNC